MHEFGHYVDSHYWGLSYLMCIGIPSLYSAIRNEDYKEKELLIDGLPTKIIESPRHRHSLFWTEKRANRRAWRHFSRRFGVFQWDEYGIHKKYFILKATYPLH